jgi:hypothetical protein
MWEIKISSLTWSCPQLRHHVVLPTLWRDIMPPSSGLNVHLRSLIIDKWTVTYWFWDYHYHYPIKIKALVLMWNKINIVYNSAVYTFAVVRESMSFVREFSVQYKVLALYILEFLQLRFISSAVDVYFGTFYARSQNCENQLLEPLVFWTLPIVFNVKHKIIKSQSFGRTAIFRNFVIFIILCFTLKTMDKVQKTSGSNSWFSQFWERA